MTRATFPSDIIRHRTQSPGLRCVDAGFMSCADIRTYYNSVHDRAHAQYKSSIKRVSGQKDTCVYTCTLINVRALLYDYNIIQVQIILSLHCSGLLWRNIINILFEIKFIIALLFNTLALEIVQIISSYCIL